jgi:hypothetical protein
MHSIPFILTIFEYLFDFAMHNHPKNKKYHIRICSLDTTFTMEGAMQLLVVSAKIPKSEAYQLLSSLKKEKPFELNFPESKSMKVFLIECEKLGLVMSDASSILEKSTDQVLLDHADLLEKWDQLTVQLDANGVPVLILEPGKKGVVLIENEEELEIVGRELIGLGSEVES